MLTLTFLFLFAVIIYVIATPIIRLYRSVKKARKEMQSFFNGANGGNNYGDDEQEQSRRQEKKIGPNVGEYVEFEEIHEQQPQSESSDTRENYASSSQIEDAEWEDIKD
jgi:hypothetical protein